MITGKSRVFGVIADPISHVRAPELFNAVFEAKSLDAVLVPVHVSADELARLWDGFRTWQNFGGFCVTVPHKEAALRLADEAGEQARLVGAANVVRREPDGRLIADNFDGRGFVAGLDAHGLSAAGKRVLLVGAGGAGMAIAFALAEAGVAELKIANRTLARAEALAARVASAFPAVEVGAHNGSPEGFDLIANATALGLNADDPLPLDVEALSSAQAVADIVMKPERTKLLIAAEARGCRIHLGKHMLDFQRELLGGFLRIDASTKLAST